MDRLTTDTESRENQEIRSGAESEPLIQMEPNPQKDVFALTSTDSSAMQMAPLVTNESSMDVEEDMNEEESSEDPELTDTGPEGSLPDAPPEDDEENRSNNSQASGRYTSRTDTNGNGKDLENDLGQPMEARSDTPGERPQMPDITTLTETTQESVAAVRPSPEEDKMATDRSTSKQEQPAPTEAGQEAGQLSADGEPAETSAEGVSEGGEDVQKTLETGSSEAMMRSLTSMSATDFVNGMKEASAAAASLQEEEKKQQQESLPEIDQPTGIPTKTQKKAEETKLKKEGAPDLEEKGDEEGKQVETEHKQAEGPVPGANVSRFREPEGGEEEDSGSWWSRLFSRIRSYLSSLPDSDSGVNTSAGKRPNVDLSGKADPGQNKEHKAKADTKIEKNKADAHKETAKDFGEHDIYPDIETGKLSPSVQIEGAEPREGKPLEKRELDTEVQSALNTNLQPRMNDEVAPKNQEFEEAHQKYETDSAREKEEGLAKITEETERVKAEQEGEQATAKNEVESEREKWREENENVKERYEEQSAEKKKEIDQKIDKEVTSAEEKADKKLDEAEKKAENEKRIAEEKARKKKQEAKNKPKSFWGRVKGAVSSVFDKIRSAINAIFEGLRKLVKGIIEAAKKLVKGIIELARRAVVGLIKAFGEALKKFVSIALAAFPELAKKARAAIDRAVNKAVETVNKAAQALKDFADKVLDAIGAALDFIISVYQKVYNAILDALEFIAIGLIEVMEAISNLVAAAKEMADHFWEQMLGELFGVDEPLPFEKTTESGSSEASGSVPRSEVAPSAEGLVNKPNLGQNDISVDNVPVIEFESEVSKKLLSMADGEEQEFEGAENPITMDELKSAAMAQSGGGSETAGSAAEGEGKEVSVDDQLQNMIDNIPSTCKPDKNAEPAKSGEFPESAKIGPLTLSQRLKFVTGAMKKGIASWWECNKVTIIAAIVGLLVGAVILNILTGGAVMAAIPPLLKILAAFFLAEALAKATSYFGDFFVKGINGDITGAAKALARAIAILAIELVFAVVFSFRAIFKALKGGLKGAIKTGTKAAKASVKATGQAFKELGKVSIDGGKAVIKNGKLIFKGVRGGFGKGVKSIDDLLRKLRTRFRFKKFKIRRNGLRFSLFGKFNPWVLLASGEIKEVKRGDLAGSSAAGAVTKYKGPAGKRFTETVDAIVLGSKQGEDYSKIFKDLGREGVVETLSKKLASGSITRRDIKWFLEMFKNADEEGKRILTILAKDSQTPWKLLRETANATKKGGKINWAQVSGKLRGMSGEIVTQLTGEAGKLLLNGKALNIIESQVRTATKRVLDFAVTAVDDTGKKMLMEVKAFTTETWEKSLSAFIKRSKKVGKLTKDEATNANKISRLIDQLKSGASETGNKVILTVTDNITPKQLKQLQDILKENSVAYEIIKINNAEVIRISNKIKSTLKLTKSR